MEITQEINALQNFQCTKSAKNGAPSFGRYCYCLDCDCSPDNGKKICEYCAFFCHNEHEVGYGGTGSFVCDCPHCQLQSPKDELVVDEETTIPCLSGHIPFRCTLQETKNKFYIQHVYKCLTCKQGENEGVCAVCAKVCHSGHELEDRGINPFFCDCGSGSIKGFQCRCNDPSYNPENDNQTISLPFQIPFRCTHLFTNEKAYNQRGFYCKTCGIEKEPICEVCATKCHKGHDLQDLGLKPFVCNCNKNGTCKCQDDTNELFVPAICASVQPDIEYDCEEEDCGCHCGHHHCEGCCGGHHH